MISLHQVGYELKELQKKVRLLKKEIRRKDEVIEEVLKQLIAKPLDKHLDV